MSDSVRERLASIETQIVDNNKKLTALFDLMNPTIKQVASHEESLSWIKKSVFAVATTTLVTLFKTIGDMVRR